ncbi:TonB-linked outer membrane protein, SusC/RagA family [Chitinophaga ginsengisegetis]|uniref:TonB-linked outer membrane protein, SusC/RagA family n=1 Tax=Chitinophaga ginsengisegetis TaxID=393003 RepID=A0A1T5NK17_9BACT|nr:TonB-dependent receptor [Chitinophaga ginsengisegetis]SKD00553.1 TonB-linked outer membrane protein, SusC/RagA family [Chitinophaga ginsengisegetis]
MKFFSRFRLLKPATFLLLCIGIIGAGSLSLHAQDIPVTGKVTAANGTPLIGVNVQVAGTSRGAATDVNGAFKLTAPKDATLKFTFIGYLPKEVKVKSATVLVVLQEDIQKLNDVVVVGYGTQKKATLTGAITTVNMVDKEGQPLTNVSNALHGVPGVFANLSNSQPGVDRSTIRIRGLNTFGSSDPRANDPLVLVDGIEYSMDELNPNDIETVTVLKDAAAAIYGSRGSNGVILVTTKKGRGTSRVNYSYYYGQQKATYLPDVITDPIAYMKLKNQALINEGKAIEYAEADIDEYQKGMATDPFTYPANDWYKIALKNGVIQKHDLSISGSSDKYQYRLSLGYLDRNGILFGPGNHEKKYSVGLNASMDVTKRLRAGITMDGYYRTYTTPFYTDTWNYLARTLPILTDTLRDGRYGNSWLRTAGRNNWENPRMLAYNGLQTKQIQRFLTTVFAEYKLPFDINYNIKFGVDKYDGLLSGFTPRMQTFNPKTGAPINWNSPATAPRSAKTDFNDMNIHFYNTLDWKHQFKEKHNLSAMLGASYDNFDSDSWAASMYGYLDGRLDALSVGTTWNATSGNLTRDVLESYFGRVNYDYDGKYLLEATFRYDGSSRLGKHSRWAFFPSVSAGWRIDKEAFFHSDFINVLKLRASAGKLGNQAIALYTTEPMVNLGEDYSFGGVLNSGAAKIADADSTLRWEITNAYNVGVDVNLWNNRIGLTVDAYKKRTNGILREVGMPSQVGNLAGAKQNVGTVDNTGFEVTAQYRDHIGEVDLNVYGSVAYNKNEVVDLHGEIIYGTGTITQAGSPIESFYILQAEGIFQNQAEIAASAKQSANTKPGYIKFRDVNNDGIINGDDRVIVNSSSSVPKYTYGFGFNVGYKGITLSAAFQGIGGVKVLPTANLAYPFNNGANATWEWTRDAWTPEKPNARLPIVTTSTGSIDNFQRSTFWLRDNSYLRMKNIQLGYALPQLWLSKAKIQKVSVFINAENLLTFSRYKDFDPESILDQTTLYTYPMLKTFNGGINVTF